MKPIKPTPHPLPLQGAPPLRRKYQTFIREGDEGKAEAIATIAKPKDWAFRKQTESRAKLVMPHRAKALKFKRELWNQTQLSNFFRVNAIYASHTDWHVSFNEPARKMTASDQVELLLAPSSTEYEIEINENRMHLIIDRIFGNADSET